MNVGKVANESAVAQEVGVTSASTKKEKKAKKKPDWSKVSKFNLKKEEKKKAKKAKKIAKKNETVYMDADLMASL